MWEVERGIAMTTALRLDTHEVFNQSPPYENVDLFLSDRPLFEAVEANGAGGEAAALSAFGRQWGTAGARGALLHGGASREWSLVPDHHDPRGAGAARG
jgi:hypothetical protein